MFMFAESDILACIMHVVKYLIVGCKNVCKVMLARANSSAIITHEVNLCLYTIVVGCFCSTCYETRTLLLRPCSVIDITCVLECIGWD
jgi:hypothetical protein